MMNSKYDGKNKYGYYMFPVGWYDFLKPVIKENPYSEVITFLEQYDNEENIKRVNDILYNGEIKETIMGKVEKLKLDLKKLKSPSEIIKDIVYGEEL